MSTTPSAARGPRGSGRSRPTLRIGTVGLLTLAILALGIPRPTAVAAVGHLLISEVMTGGASASDEIIELYNPSGAALPLDGLELVYVTASGATVTRRASWGLGAPTVPTGGHLLVANELGIFAAIADATYAGGMAAAGGSVALRIQGATTAVDAVGWGTAASTWLEGRAAAAPLAGSSLERLPGGSDGSTIDTDDNLADFAVRGVPDPQNAASAPVPAPPSPSPVASPTATLDSTPQPSLEPTPDPTAEPTPQPSGEPTPDPTATEPPTNSPSPAPTAAPNPIVSIATARALPDGSPVTIEAAALTGSAFADGGGYLDDGTGGIAVLLDDGAFARGDRVVVSGTVDDRFAQRTVRATGATTTFGASLPDPVALATGAVDESVESRLVRIEGAIDGGATVLADGLAFNVDDGSGAARVVVAGTTGIATAEWTDGRRVAVVGVTGQRDSSGTGMAGYRVQPRDPADVELRPIASPSPSPRPSTQPSADPEPTRSPSATEPPTNVVTIAQAREAARNAKLTVRGVVTLASGTVEKGSAVVQDATGAILLRLSGGAGELALGQLVEVQGSRSTKSGMESLRVSTAPRVVGTGTPLVPRAHRTGDAGEASEAQLVVVRGGLVASARRAPSGSVSFDLDDGSGPLRVVIGAALAAEDEGLERGAWVEVTGVLGQQTTGAEPLRGYRVWPRTASDVRVVAPVTSDEEDGQDGDDLDEAGDGARGAPLSRGGPGPGSLDAIGIVPLGELRIGATLVAGRWDDLGLAGLLWDGRTLVGISAGSAGVLDRALGARHAPVTLELAHLASAGTSAELGIPVVTLGSGVADVVLGSGHPARPLGRLPDEQAAPAWVSVVGRLVGELLNVDGSAARLDRRCADARPPRTARLSVTGVALTSPTRILVPCDGLRAAPTLDLARGASADAVPGPSGEALVSLIAPATAQRPSSLGAVLLLAAAAALLAVAIAARRRGELRGGAGAEVHGGAGAEVESVPDGSAGATARLTLVSVPREHG